LREALGLYLSLVEGDARAESIRLELQEYLYRWLSIEEMETPQALFDSLSKKGMEKASDNR
jgi:hypothetical protein